VYLILLIFYSSFHEICCWITLHSGMTNPQRQEYTEILMQVTKYFQEIGTSQQVSSEGVQLHK